MHDILEEIGLGDDGYFQLAEGGGGIYWWSLTMAAVASMPVTPIHRWVGVGVAIMSVASVGARVQSSCNLMG